MESCAKPTGQQPMVTDNVSALVESRRCPYQNIQGKHIGKSCGKVGTACAVLLYGDADPALKDVYYCNTHYLRLAGRLKFGGRSGRGISQVPSFQQLFSPVETDVVKREYVQLRLREERSKAEEEEKRKHSESRNKKPRTEEREPVHLTPVKREIMSEDEEEDEEPMEDGEVREQTTQWGNLHPVPLQGWHNPYGTDNMAFGSMFSAIRGGARPHGF